MTKPIAKLTSKRINTKPVLITTSLALLLIIGAISGHVGYYIAYARCGTAPVNATQFAAAHSYFLPGERGHGPRLFNSEYFCTQTEAEAAGYHHSPLAKKKS